MEKPKQNFELIYFYIQQARCKSASSVQELVGYCNNRSKSGEAVDIGRAAFQTSLDLLSDFVLFRRMRGHLGKLLKLFDALLNERLELKRLGNSDDNTDVLDQLLKLLQTNEIHKPRTNHLFAVT